MYKNITCHRRPVTFYVDVEARTSPATILLTSKSYWDLCILYTAGDPYTQRKARLL